MYVVLRMQSVDVLLTFAKVVPSSSKNVSLIWV
jgi:hypothetical protein